MKNIFVATGNATTFFEAMKQAESQAMRDARIPLFLVFHSKAGRGKTEAATKYAADEDWVYVRCNRGWRTSELWMLQDLCFELSIEPIPHRKKACFDAIVAALRQEAHTMLVDDADKMPVGHLEWMRDFADITLAPIALLGEDRLKTKMFNEKRLWSRTLKCIEFKPISPQDVLFFAKEACNIRLTGQQAAMMQEAAEGDFRPVKYGLLRLEEIIATNRPNGSGPRGGGDIIKCDDDMVKMAMKQAKQEIRINGVT